MHKHHLILDLGERNIKALLLKNSEGQWIDMDNLVYQTKGIYDGCIVDLEAFRESIVQCIYEVEINNKIRIREVSIIFSMHGMMKLNSVSKKVYVGGEVKEKHLHLEESQSQQNISDIYQAFQLDEGIVLPNPLGFSCLEMQANKKSVATFIHFIDALQKIMSKVEKTIYSIKFANVLPTNNIVCDIGYNSTRIRTKNDLVVLPQGAYHLLDSISRKNRISINDLEKKVSLSYFQENFNLVEECCCFFQNLFDMIFKKICSQVYQGIRLELAGMGAKVPFLSDFLMDYCHRVYKQPIEIAPVNCPLKFISSYNSNSFYFCYEMRKFIFD